MFCIANRKEFESNLRQIDIIINNVYGLREKVMGKYWKFHENSEELTEDLMDLIAFECELILLLKYKIITDCEVLEEFTSYTQYHPHQIRLLHIRDQTKSSLCFFTHFSKHIDRLEAFINRLETAEAHYAQLIYFVENEQQTKRKAIEAIEPKPSTSKKPPPVEQNEEEEDHRSHLGDLIAALNLFMTTEPFSAERPPQPSQESNDGSDRSGRLSSQGKAKKRRKDHQAPPEVPQPDKFNSEESPGPFWADFDVRVTPNGSLKGKIPPHDLSNEETMQLTVEATGFIGDIPNFGPTLDTVRDKLISLIPEHLEGRTEDILSKNDPDYEFVLCRKDNRYFELKEVFDDPSIPFNVTSRSFPIIKQDTRVIVETALGSLLIETRRDYILINKLN